MFIMPAQRRLWRIQGSNRELAALEGEAALRLNIGHDSRVSWRCKFNIMWAAFRCTIKGWYHGSPREDRTCRWFFSVGSCYLHTVSSNHSVVPMFNSLSFDTSTMLFVWERVIKLVPSSKQIWEMHIVHYALLDNNCIRFQLNAVTEKEFDMKWSRNRKQCMTLFSLAAWYSFVALSIVPSKTFNEFCHCLN